MPSTISLISALRRDFPALHFAKGDTFHWSPDEQTVFYANTTDTASLLHEVAHAALGHGDYTYDIELIKMERAAWDYVVTALGPTYLVTIDGEQIEAMMDTYRDWLHDRSRCPSCEATGMQTEAKCYTCLACNSSWRVNEARACALRRYILASN